MQTSCNEFTYEFSVHNVYLNNGKVQANKNLHNRKITSMNTFKLIKFAASNDGEEKTEPSWSLFFLPVYGCQAFEEQDLSLEIIYHFRAVI